MLDLDLAHPERVHLLWAVAALLAALLALDARGRDALDRFVSSAMQRRLAVGPSRLRRVLRIALVALALVLAVIALLRPQSRSTESTEAREATAEVMVVLDVSRSMLAEDVAPSRLERAKAEVTELVAALPGHRVGLIAFAGRASVLCPLTPDRGFFRLVLRTAGPDAVTRGGTEIGTALRAAIEGFEPGGGAKLIVLLTDGEDHESYPLDAAKEAAAAGVRIVSIGFGDEAGSEIPIVDPDTGARESLRDRDGRVVVSRLDGETLRAIALETDGAYVPAATGVLDLESIVRRHVEPLLTAGAASAVRTVRAERYQGFLLAAMLAIVGAVLLGSGIGVAPREG